jgi:hypothetical protein
MKAEMPYWEQKVFTRLEVFLLFLIGLILGGWYALGGCP